MRLIFEDYDEFSRWVNNFGRRGYVAYLTSSRELILVPLKSTRPLIYAYIRLGEVWNERNREIRALLERLNIDLFYLKDVEWDDTKPLGVKIPVEE